MLVLNTFNQVHSWLISSWLSCIGTAKYVRNIQLLWRALAMAPIRYLIEPILTCCILKKMAGILYRLDVLGDFNMTRINSENVQTEQTSPLIWMRDWSHKVTISLQSNLFLCIIFQLLIPLIVTVVRGLPYLWRHTHTMASWAAPLPWIRVWAWCDVGGSSTTRTAYLLQSALLWASGTSEVCFVYVILLTKPSSD